MDGMTEKTARRELARFGWAVLALLAAHQGAGMLLAAGLRALAASGRPFWTAAAENGRTYLLLGDLALYGAGLPVFAGVLRSVPVRPGPEGRRIPPGERGPLIAVTAAAVWCGSLAGSGLSALIEGVTGRPLSDPLEILAGGGALSLPAAFLFLVAVPALGEEFLFRKMLLERLRPYGEKTAVLYSGLVFALFHGSLTQFFYAFPLGALFAYVTCRTGGIRTSVLLHGLVNLAGGFLPLLLMRTGGAARVLLPVAGAAETVCAVCGIVTAARRGKTAVFRPGVSPLTGRETARRLFLSPGGLLFAAAALSLTVSAAVL